MRLTVDRSIRHAGNGISEPVLAMLVAVLATSEAVLATSEATLAMSEAAAANMDCRIRRSMLRFHE
ncbi:hypothetical protein GCM10027280_30220 [Micromonospora polyrhachis]|uniref:Uncharacterized protein n=1 Tax=Micromonospora polyrhachis TaxID=1282883 RepID=A0A7W7WRL6_9ACTN|nr:hypothetical protein [Micromonospora polyrhachis]